jgi:hypothetical protein
LSRQYALQELSETKTYNVWLNKVLGPIPWWGWWSVSDNKDIIVAWDSSKTTMTSAKLRLVATAGGSSNLDISVNNRIVAPLEWSPLEAGVQKDMESGDISSFLTNGDNLFIANHYKDPGSPLETSATFSVTLVIEFEGTPPDTGEKPEWQIWLETNWPLVAIGAGVVVLGGVAMGASSR